MSSANYFLMTRRHDGMYGEPYMQLEKHVKANTEKVLYETRVKLGLERSGVDTGEITNEGHVIIEGRGTEDVYVKQLRNVANSILDISLLI